MEEITIRLLVTGGFDRDGNYVSGVQKVIEMRLKDQTLESMPATSITVKNTVDIASGSFVVRFVVRDAGQQPPFGPGSQARNVMIPKMPESTLDAQNIVHILADGTGGFVIRNTNDLFAGLRKMGTEMDEYYILG